MIPFNKPFLQGKELEYVAQSIASRKFSGDGEFTKKCHKFFELRYGFEKALLTTSCTDALEMCSILLDIQPGDEVIVPAFTFVSSANAFALRGAKLVFVDSQADNPNLDVYHVESLISNRTKAIIAVHYAGIACHMDELLALAKRRNIFVVEDAAQAIDSFYKGKPLGSFGSVSAFSFHETKNIVCGEGGMICVNDHALMKRAEVIREKGTNRSAFFRGEVDKYGWVDIGSSFLPSDILAAFLLAQLESMDLIQLRRKEIWNSYDAAFKSELNKYGIQLPYIPEWATNNAHMYYLVLPDLEKRTTYIENMRRDGVATTFHYLSLNSSPYSREQRHEGPPTPNADRYTNCLVRLPLFPDLTNDDVDWIIEKTINNIQLLC
jgi:dTDP-4-amino-4,6-dideoxygalactose transaminase